MKALLVLLVIAIPVRAHAKGCHEVSSVVGYEHCSWFGTWSRDTPVFPFWLDLTYYHHSYASEPYSLEASAAHTAAPGDLATTAQGFLFRMLAGRLVYAGIELGGGALSTRPRALDGAMPAFGSAGEGHLIVGAHVALWRFGLGAELAAGGRFEVLASCDPHVAACMQASDTQARRELELRVHADLFLTPRWSLGVLAGKSAIDAGDRELLIYTGIHVRALDGAP